MSQSWTSRGSVVSVMPAQGIDPQAALPHGVGVKKEAPLNGTFAASVAKNTRRARCFNFVVFRTSSNISLEVTISTSQLQIFNRAAATSSDI